MRKGLRKNTLVLILLFILLLSSITPGTEATRQRSALSAQIQDEIILQGIHVIENISQKPLDTQDALSDLKTWYTSHPLIESASLIGSSMTIQFIDGSYTVIMDPFQETDSSLINQPSASLHERHDAGNGHTALLLNAAESMYGSRQCRTILNIFIRHHYSVEYVANQAVDLSFIRHNLTADVVYMNTHAGYFDVDGDQQADAVVIATGERWTNDTEQTYAFEYENKFIVKGMVGEQGFIAFTPAFIDYYYAPGDFPESLMFLATCYATYDESMAQEFIDAGVSVYIGWSHNTVFWTNSRTSVSAFRLLVNGFTAQQVCRLIGSGGFYNWLFHSKLIYYGNGEHRIPS